MKDLDIENALPARVPQGVHDTVYAGRGHVVQRLVIAWCRTKQAAQLRAEWCLGQRSGKDFPGHSGLGAGLHAMQMDKARLRKPGREKILRVPAILPKMANIHTAGKVAVLHPDIPEIGGKTFQIFYRKVFRDYKEPLFWIHLNMDYPFNLKGILYFPKINTEYDSIEGTIKLYNNQVFIADNIKEVIPEFLMLLKGVIDCPDLPLNVSRSALQNDGFVKKISDYISKKVADKLTGMCKTDRENYEKYWDDISPFIKFGCLKDEKFCDKMMDYILFKDLNGKYLTLKDLVPEEEASAGAEDVDIVEDADQTAAEDKSGEETKEDGKEPEKTTIFYVTDEIQQSQYINMFKEEGKNAVILKHNIDTPFISHLEMKNEHIKFQRIDADLTEDFVESTDEEALKETTDSLTEIFRKALNNDKLEVKVEKMKNENISSMITLSEESRRMQDMMKMYSMDGSFDAGMFGGQTLVLNANNKLVQYILNHKDGENVNLFCEQLYDLALISHQPLSPDAMTKFIARSNEIMMLLAK